MINRCSFLDQEAQEMKQFKKMVFEIVLMPKCRIADLATTYRKNNLQPAVLGRKLMYF